MHCGDLLRDDAIRRLIPMATPLDDTARRRMADNLGLAHSFAVRHAGWAASIGLQTDDLLDLAMDRLLAAARGFRPELGFTFGTYAFRAMRVGLIQAGTDRFRPTRNPPGGALVEIDAACPNGRPKQYVDRREPDGQVAADARDLIATVWPHLSERERIVLRGRYWHGETLAEIAGRLGLSKQRVQQIEREALRTCRGLVGA